MAPFTLNVSDIRDGTPIPERYVRCMADGNGGHAQGENHRPALAWSGVPEGTRSYAIVVVDRDVPASFDDANQPGKMVRADMERQNFYHWLQADIPGSTAALAEGPPGRAEPGVSGRSSYGERGTEGGIGYDGPCPPWNDERLHRYHFILYALDVPTLGLEEGFGIEDMEETMKGHILAQAEAVGSYSTNDARIAAWL